MHDEREAKIREAAEEVFKSFLRNINVLKPDGGRRSLSTTITVVNTDSGYGHSVILAMIEKLECGRETEVMHVVFTER